MKKSKKVEVIGKKPVQTELGKRFGIPSRKLRADCPKCGNHVELDLADCLPYYTISGKWIKMPLHCASPEGHPDLEPFDAYEFEIQVRVSIEVEAKP